MRYIVVHEDSGPGTSEYARIVGYPWLVVDTYNGRNRIIGEYISEHRAWNRAANRNRTHEERMAIFAEFGANDEPLSDRPMRMTTARTETRGAVTGRNINSAESYRCSDPDCFMCNRR